MKKIILTCFITVLGVNCNESANCSAATNLQNLPSNTAGTSLLQLPLPTVSDPEQPTIPRIPQLISAPFPPCVFNAQSMISLSSCLPQDAQKFPDIILVPFFPPNGELCKLDSADSTEQKPKERCRYYRKLPDWHAPSSRTADVSMSKRIQNFNDFTLATQTRTVQWGQLAKWFDRFPTIKPQLSKILCEIPDAFEWWQGKPLDVAIWKINCAILHPKIIPLLYPLSETTRKLFMSQICKYDKQYCEIEDGIHAIGKQSRCTTKYAITINDPFPPVPDTWEMDIGELAFTAEEQKLKKQIETIVIQDWKEYASSRLTVDKKTDTSANMERPDFQEELGEGERPPKKRREDDDSLTKGKGDSLTEGKSAPSSDSKVLKIRIILPPAYSPK